MRVLVTGSRSWNLETPIAVALSLFGPDTVIVHGDAPKGADRIADHWGRELGFTVEVHPADWKHLGKRAGVVRNLEMLDTSPDLVLAFWDGVSRGTQHCIDAARERGIPVQVISP